MVHLLHIQFRYHQQSRVFLVFWPCKFQKKSFYVGIHKISCLKEVTFETGDRFICFSICPFYLKNLDFGVDEMTHVYTYYT